MAKDQHIPINFLRECFRLDTATGVIYWLSRPREHFATRRAWTVLNTRCANKPAGTNTNGYLQIVIMCGNQKYRLQAHRIAFALVHDHWPDGEIDHINGERADNKPTNLREASRAENAHNAVRRRNNTSGLRGVSWNRERRKWAAQICIQGRQCNLGRFDTKEDAFRAVLRAWAMERPFQPLPRDMNEHEAAIAADVIQHGHGN
jgi:hypothetical protein